jgi:hypothetical protein
METDAAIEKPEEEHNAKATRATWKKILIDVHEFPSQSIESSLFVSHPHPHQT